MAKTITTEELGVSVQKPRIGWALGGISILAIAAVVAAAVAVLSQGPTAVSTGEQAIAPLYTEDELAVIRLVEKGVLPDEVLTSERFRTKQLVNEGVLPRETLETRLAPVAPLYCEDERAVMAAVAAGVIPRQVLQGELFRTKRLINQGLVPREAARPC
jgi:hypothetical protein